MHSIKSVQHKLTLPDHHMGTSNPDKNHNKTTLLESRLDNKPPLGEMRSKAVLAPITSLVMQASAAVLA